MHPMETAIRLFHKNANARISGYIPASYIGFAFPKRPGIVPAEIFAAFLDPGRRCETVRRHTRHDSSRNAAVVAARSQSDTHTHLLQSTSYSKVSPAPFVHHYDQLLRPLNRRLYHLRTFFQGLHWISRCVTYHDDGTHHPRAQVHLTEILPCIAVLVFFPPTPSLFLSFSLSLCLFSLYLTSSHPPVF